MVTAAPHSDASRAQVPTPSTAQSFSVSDTEPDDSVQAGNTTLNHRKRKDKNVGQAEQVETSNTSNKIVVKVEDEGAEAGPASFYPSPSSPSNRPVLETRESPVDLEAKVALSKKGTPKSVIYACRSSPVCEINSSTSREMAQIKRPKVEHLNDGGFVLQPGICLQAPGLSTSPQSKPPPLIPPSRPSSPVAEFLLHTCKPPIPTELRASTTETFKNLGVKTAADLRALAAAGEAQEFWMENARKEGLTVLWEAIVRTGLKKVLAGS
ncbi:MAG: hypothetical protein CYPHOPRED_005759 [Cyphobasidiales sp. Tagirdzhanova-0007]|nr:MAG: hypothetical protein CYPHOPRED_005759 [Cyphobasidiales sp. Tagirdzhanova-0007]